MPSLDIYQPSTLDQWRARFSRAWAALRSRELSGSDNTSEEGSLKSDPYADRYLRRWQEPQERDKLADEIAEIKADHPIAVAALDKFITGALNDLKITVESAAGGTIEAARATRIIERIEGNCSLPDLVQQVGSDTVWFGNCFGQPVINQQSEIVDCLQMPVKGMVRNTNIRDEFHEPDRAFIQRGPGGGSISESGGGTYEIAAFGVGQIIHVRYNCRQGERYGESKIFSARAVAKDSSAALRSLLPRRLANQPFRHFSIGGLNGKGVGWQIFAQIKNKLSRLLHIRKGGEISPFDDVFTNNCKVEVLGGDPEADSIGDIEMLIDSLLGLVGVSRQLLGGSTGAQRDVADEVKEELYKNQRQLKTIIEKQFVRPLIDLGLALAGIIPTRIKYRVDCSDQYTDSRAERRIENSRLDYKEGLISRRTCVAIRASYYGVENIDEELQAIQSEDGKRPVQPSSFGGGRPDTLPGLPGQDRGQQPPIQGRPGRLLALPSHRQLKDQRVQRILQWNGLPIGIEYERGDKRFDRPMAYLYGHIRGTYGMGGDGESIDVYINERNPDSKRIFRVTQLSPDLEFDEYKYFLGFNSATEARAAYVHQMPIRFFGGIEEVGIEEITPVKNRIS